MGRPKTARQESPVTTREPCPSRGDSPSSPEPGARSQAMQYKRLRFGQAFTSCSETNIRRLPIAVGGEEWPSSRLSGSSSAKACSCSSSGARRTRPVRPDASRYGPLSSRSRRPIPKRAKSSPPRSRDAASRHHDQFLRGMPSDLQAVESVERSHGWTTQVWIDQVSAIAAERTLTPAHFLDRGGVTAAALDLPE
jgi:hypothetical protein